MFYKSFTLFASAVYEWNGAGPDPNPAVRIGGYGYGPGVIFQVNPNVPHLLPPITGSGSGIMGHVSLDSIHGTIHVLTTPVLSGQQDPIGLTGEIGSGHAALVVIAAPQPLDTQFGATGEVGSGHGLLPATRGYGRCENGVVGVGYGRLSAIAGRGTRSQSGEVGSGVGTVVVLGSSELSYSDAVGSGIARIVVRGRSETANRTGIVSQTNTVYAMNLSTGAVSQHTTQYNSWCVIDGVLYGADSAGIHRIVGFADNGTPITSRMSKVGMDFGSSFNKFFTDIYFRGRTTGDHKITVSSERAVGSVTMVDGVDEYHGAKADLPKGVYGRELGLTVENVDGAHFEWSDIEIICGESQNRRGRQISRG